MGLGNRDVLDLSRPSDERCIRKHVAELFEYRPVRTRLRRRRHYDGKVEELTKRSVSFHILFEHRGIPVAAQLEKTDLVIDDKKRLKWKSSVGRVNIVWKCL
jgi:hypothetical protein